MQNIVFDTDTLTASEDDRIISGVLIPYDVEGQTNLGKFTVPRGVLEIPSDPAQMSVNVEHKREAAFGGGVQITDTPAGLMFAARCANTPEGDQALADVKNGVRGSWSVEAAGMVVKAGRAVAGRVFGAALVARPAFPGATLLASLEDDEEGNVTATTTEEDGSGSTEGSTEGSSEPTETVETYTDEFTDENGVTHSRKTTTTTRTEGDTTTVTTVTEIVEPEAPTDTPEEENSIVSTLTASARAGATRIGTITRGPVTAGEQQPQDLSTLYAAISDARIAPTPDAADTLMAALTALKTSGSLGPAGGSGNKGLPYNWAGALWDGREYDRRFINHGTLGTDISARGKYGYRVRRGTKSSPLTRFDGNYAGELNEIKSANAFVEESSSTLHQWALANQIERAFFDLPGGAEYLEAFFKLIVEDYAIWSDEMALASMLTAAGTVVAPQDHLSGYPAQSQYPAAMVQLIQGVRTINRRRDTATFAFVNQAAYDELIYTPKDLVPEFVSFDVTTERTGTADAGKVVIVEASNEDGDLFKDVDGKALIDSSKPAVLVGASRAIEFDELGTTPLTIDALEIAKGGVDRATHGYLQVHKVRPESLVLIGTAAAAG